MDLLNCESSKSFLFLVFADLCLYRSESIAATCLPSGIVFDGDFKELRAQCVQELREEMSKSGINPRTGYYQYIDEIVFELVFDDPSLLTTLAPDALFNATNRLEFFLKTFITASSLQGFPEPIDDDIAPYM